jgi:signal transduction histidine kinase
VRRVHVADWTLAAVLAVTGFLEVVVTGVDGQRPAMTGVLALIAAGAMLLRTAWPLLCLAVLVILVVISQVPGAGLTLTAAVVFGCLLALASVGRHCEDRTSVPAGVATIGFFVVGAAFTSRPWDVVIGLLGCGAAWGAGRLLRREAQRNLELSSLAADLMKHREVLAMQAVQAERIRIARELHDAVAHTVSVMTLQAGGVRRQLDTEPHRARERMVLLDVEKLGREAVTELHRMLGVLRSPEDDAAGTVHADGLAPQPRLTDIHQLAARVRAAGVPVEVRVEGATRSLPAGLELAAYRVVQEALTNVLKHGGGATARVILAYTETEIRLHIQDDGPTRGDPADPGRVGHGIAGMRERVGLYGGRLEAGPVPDSGFVVRATLPLPALHSS